MKLNQKNLTITICLITFSILSFPCLAEDLKTIDLSSMDLTKMTSGWGEPVANKSVAKNPLTMDGKVYENGVGTHAKSEMYIDLNRQAQRFTALAGLDDEVKTAPEASVIFQITGDGKILFSSDSITPSHKPIEIDISLKNVKILALIVQKDINETNSDHADWVNAKITYIGQTPKAIKRPGYDEKEFILTPPPGTKPKINGPLVYGARPGHDFIYRIPTTGTRPIAFEVENLPATLNLDKNTGIITGTTPKEIGEYEMTLNAKNSIGSAEKSFKLIVGDTLALTPPMGWNHWYIHWIYITDELVREAAEKMIESGLADFGYQYVNIDDCWTVAIDENPDDARKGKPRDDQGNILCNKYFPDMYALTEYIHSLGLKAGIYTTAGPVTCAKFAGSYQHEQQDVEQIAAWGFDFLKHDWCSYSEIIKEYTLPEMKKPYLLMGELIKKQDRDIVFNICQGPMAEVWKWGKDADAQSWRTAGDLGYELTNYQDVARRNAKLKDYSHPGSWNDPDYLMIGKLSPRSYPPEDRKCPLTPNEQYSYMSLWSIMASPLFLSGDIAQLDDFTKNILCNAEVIEINQDQLGKEGYPVIAKNETEIWKKDLYDGSIAIGMFNLAELPQKVTLNLKDLNLKGQYKMRDLWRQKDIGSIKDSYTKKIPRHGVILLRLYPK